MINNAVKDAHGNVIGYRCSVCGEIYTSMWGNVCNKCREERKFRQQLLEALKNTKEENS